MSLLPWRMANQLIRSRVLDDRRNSANEFMVAVDGVHMHTLEGTLPKAVYKQVNGVAHSVFAALEAKLVTPDGMGFSVCTQFIENEEAYVKQDCELKAFHRLAETLKGRFPRLPLCLLLDGLYPNKNVLDICAANQWSFHITLKDGVIPKLHAAAAEQLAKHPEQALDDSPGPGVHRHVSWATNLDHEGRPVNVLVCEETTLTKGGFVKKRFVWLTNAKPNRKNVVQLVEEARCRWVIEETFNVQKNNEEYRLGHVCGRVGHAMKNYYYLPAAGGAHAAPAHGQGRPVPETSAEGHHPEVRGEVGGGKGVPGGRRQDDAGALQHHEELRQAARRVVPDRALLGAGDRPGGARGDPDPVQHLLSRPPAHAQPMLPVTYRSTGQSAPRRRPVTPGRREAGTWRDSAVSDSPQLGLRSLKRAGTAIIVG